MSCRCTCYFLAMLLVLGCQKEDGKTPDKAQPKLDAKQVDEESDRPEDLVENPAETALVLKRATAKSDIRSIMTAVKMHKLKERYYPKTLEALGQSGGGGPYLESLPKDPWGHRYHYENNSGRVRLLSYGRDGKAGGIGENQDIDPFPIPKVNEGGKNAVK